MRSTLLRRVVPPLIGLALAFPTAAFAADPTTTELQDQVTSVASALNQVWVVLAAILVLFMQAGFAMLEIGLSRMKNAGAVAGKIIINVAISFLMFWAVLVIIGSFFRGPGFNFAWPWLDGLFFEF